MFSKVCLFSLLFVGSGLVGGVDAADAPITDFFSDGVDQQCACEFNAETDYFPVKLQPSYAKGFSVEYRNHYKIITVDVAGETITYYAHLCGTPAPEIPNGAISVEIPLRNVGVASTTYIPHLEYIQQRNTLKVVSVPKESIISSCIVKNIDAGVTTDLPAGKIEESHLRDLHLDAVFTGSYTHAGHQKLIEDSCSSTVPIYFNEGGEKTALGRAEWVEFAALFFNREEAALSVTESIASRYNCTANYGSNIVNKPNVLRFSYFGGKFYGSSCPNYYCGVYEDAGAKLIEMGTLNVTEVIDTVDLVNIDVVVYQGDYAGLTEEGKADVDAVIDLTKAKANKRVFDATKSTSSALFQSLPAEPDLYLQDIYSIVAESDEITRTFFRNIQDPNDVSTDPADAECPDVNAPLDTNWKTNHLPECRFEETTFPPVEEPITSCKVTPGNTETFGCDNNGATAASTSMLLTGLAATAAMLVGAQR